MSEITTAERPDPKDLSTLESAPRSSHTGDSNSCLPDLELGALFIWLASRMLSGQASLHSAFCSKTFFTKEIALFQGEYGEKGIAFFIKLAEEARLSIMYQLYESKLPVKLTRVRLGTSFNF